jgi:hypothetical protein
MSSGVSRRAWVMGHIAVIVVVLIKRQHQPQLARYHLGRHERTRLDRPILTLGRPRDCHDEYVLG